MSISIMTLDEESSLFVLMVRVVMLIVIMLIVIMLIVIVLIVIMMIVIMMIVIILRVVAPVYSVTIHKWAGYILEQMLQKFLK
jgi:hypothetical protein